MGVIIELLGQIVLFALFGGFFFLMGVKMNEEHNFRKNKNY
jgi:hypothetical protein